MFCLEIQYFILFTNSVQHKTLHSDVRARRNHKNLKENLEQIFKVRKALFINV